MWMFVRQKCRLNQFFIAACSFGKEQDYRLSDSPEWICQNDVIQPLCCRKFSGKKHPDRENNSRVNLLRFQNKNPHAGREKLKPTFSLHGCLEELRMSVWYYIHVFLLSISISVIYVFSTKCFTRHTRIFINNSTSVFIKYCYTHCFIWYTSSLVNLLVLFLR